MEDLSRDPRTENFTKPLPLPYPDRMSLSAVSLAETTVPDLSPDGRFRRILEFKKRELLGILSPAFAQSAAELHAASIVLQRVDPSNTVLFFGGANAAGCRETDFVPGKDDEDSYKNAMETARLLGREGFNIMTGGGPGIMEAGNRGAALAMEEDPALRIESVGCNIKLPSEQRPNPYQTLSLEFEKLAPRKESMIGHSGAVLVYPGRYGTLDELFEVQALVQTGKIRELSPSARHNSYPVILVGKRYWTPLLKWLEERLPSSTESKGLMLADSPQEVAAILKKWKSESISCPAGKEALPDLSTLAQ